MKQVRVGVDGCKGGWFFFRFESDETSYGVVERFSDLIADVPDHARVFADIPIGLRESGTAERLCDKEARRVLTARRGSSVFPAPTRQALSAPDYEAASRTNRELTNRGLSKQSWAIAPKIQEVDALLRGSERARRIVREVHPEVCFWGIAGAPMQHYKKSREGFNERIGYLERLDREARSSIAAAFLMHGGFDAARDDIVDAYVAAVCAREHKFLRTLPERPEVDAAGIPMEIVYLDGSLLTSK